MRIRKQALGDRNIVGAKIEQKRKSMGMKQKDLLTQLGSRASTSTHRVFPSSKVSFAMLPILSSRLSRKFSVCLTKSFSAEITFLKERTVFRYSSFFFAHFFALRRTTYATASQMTDIDTKTHIVISDQRRLRRPS